MRPSPQTSGNSLALLSGGLLVLWIVGGTDPQKYDQAEKAGRLNELPSNHSPQFAPVLNPTLRVGIEAMLTAAGPWLATVGAKP